MSRLAVLKEVKEGDILIADGGFTCLKDREEVEVKRHVDPTRNGYSSPDEGLYVPCSAGRHYLDGQWNEEEEAYVGFWKKGEER